MGQSGLSWSDVEVWARLAEIEISYEDARLLVMLSSIYANKLSEATKPDCPAPWMSKETVKLEGEAAQESIRNVFDSLVTKPKDKIKKKIIRSSGKHQAL